MRAVIQRVSSASVHVDGVEVSRIGRGLLVLLGVQKGDGPAELEYMARKITEMRVFNDRKGKMNLAVTDPGIQGAILAVSQFTLLGDLRKGRRPSFDEAEEPGRAEALFNGFVDAVKARKVSIQTGVFGAMMEVSLVNDGPVTYVLEASRRD